jgi:hypothetical protein
LLVVYFFTLPQSPPRTPAMLPPSISTNGSTRVARKTPLSPQEIKKVQQQLKVAKTHMLVGRLVTPAGSNAFHSYNLALDIDPENAEANSGLAELQARLVDDIRQRIDAGDAQGAAESLEASLRAFPASGELIALQEQLK